MRVSILVTLLMLLHVSAWANDRIRDTGERACKRVTKFKGKPVEIDYQIDEFGEETCEEASPAILNCVAIYERESLYDFSYCSNQIERKSISTNRFVDNGSIIKEISIQEFNPLSDDRECASIKPRVVSYSCTNAGAHLDTDEIEKVFAKALMNKEKFKVGRAPALVNPEGLEDAPRNANSEAKDKEGRNGWESWKFPKNMSGVFGI